MPDVDLFNLFRQLLMIAVTVYCIATTVWRVHSWLRVDVDSRYRTTLMKYLVVQALRFRLREFARPLAEIGLLLALIALLFWANVELIGHG